MFTSRWLLAFALAGLSFSLPAEAIRSVVAPPYMRRIIFNFTPATGSAYADGTRIGAIMSVQVMISNLSNIVQTGNVSIEGTSAGGNEYMHASANARIMNCGGSGSTGTSTPVSFAVGPGQTITVSSVVYFTSTYGAAGNTLFDAVFTPSMKFSVDQDRGALTATMVPLWDGPVPGSGFCDGSVIEATMHGPYDISESRTGVPLLINGGRPF